MQPNLLNVPASPVVQKQRVKHRVPRARHPSGPPADFTPNTLPDPFVDWVKTQKKRTRFKGVFWNVWLDKWCAVVSYGSSLQFDHFPNEGKAAEAFDKAVDATPWLFAGVGDLNRDLPEMFEAPSEQQPIS